MANHEIVAEKEKPKVDIPKSREIYSGDINQAVITVQQVTGFEITPDWWLSEVGNQGTTEEILDRFDNAFEELVNNELGYEESEEDSNSATLNEVIASEADGELAKFDAKFADDPGSAPLREEFIDALGEHLKKKYYSDMAEAEEPKERYFELTEPEERLYSADETYRFLVHVPLGDVEERGSEIGHERGDTVLMTSLITNEHQGTFMGEGGILVADPQKESVRGVADIDVGGEIQSERIDTVEKIIQPANPHEYNQVDLQFDGTTPVGVMIKQRADGTLIGSKKRNTALIQFAKDHDLPVVRIEVEPGSAPSEHKVEVVILPEGQGEMVTVDLPYTDEEFIRSQILRIGENNDVYHANGRTRVARTMKINIYGEATQKLTEEEVKLAVDKLKDLSDTRESELVQDDINTVVEDIDSIKSNHN